jgi:hypothetical protein
MNGSFELNPAAATTIVTVAQISTRASMENA